MILGNDVANWQGDINYDVYKNNSNFILFKSTEGVGYVDPKFKRNQSEARRVKLLLGYYHFARPDLGNSGVQEADWFLSALGEIKDGEMLTLDYEPSWSGDAVTWCKRFLDRVQEKTGVKPLIYLNQSQVKNYDWKPIVDAGYGLWIASYTGNPNDNTAEIGAWKFAAMQQWTSLQTVPGIPSPSVDGDVFFGSEDAFKKYGYKRPPSSSVSPSPSSSSSSSPSPSESPSPSRSASPSMSPSPSQTSDESKIVRLTTIINSKWTWIGSKGWKVRLQQLKDILYG